MRSSELGSVFKGFFQQQKTKISRTAILFQLQKRNFTSSEEEEPVTLN